MRYYGLTNFYLSSIQQGIQNAHCIVEMAIEWGFGLTIRPQGVMFRDWAENHKTMVLLNGGNQSALEDFRLFFDTSSNPFAWGSFCEDNQSLNNALTCVGIVLPERVYEAAALLRQRTTTIIKPEDTPDMIWVVGTNDVVYELTLWEQELCERLNLCGLAK